MDDEEGCTVCGSNILHEEDGRTLCQNGHDQGRGPITAEDDGDFVRQGTIVRKKVKKEKQKITKVLRGAKAYQLFLQSWQYILWKQCHTLVHQKGLPPELWAVVRDLWTLWISKLEHRLQDASTITGDLKDESDKAETTASSGNESDTDLDNYNKHRSSKKSLPSHLYPKLIDTVAVLYIGIILLRRPVRQATMLRWILEEDLPFIHAIRHVPQDMKERLPGEYHLSLDTTAHLPGPDDLQKAVYHRIRWFDASFGMIIPSTNQNLFLLDYIRQLALPLEVYTTALRLNTIINYDFAYLDATKALETKRRQPTTYPESQLMSLVVVATKLLFPFDSDSVKRYPRDPRDATTLRLNWSAWLKAKSHYERAGEAAFDTNRLRPGSEIHIKDKDILDMTDQQLDQYMDWYHLTWIKNSGSAAQAAPFSDDGGIDKEILDMFPLADVQERSKTREQNQQNQLEDEYRQTERIKLLQASLKSQPAISEAEELERDLDILRPGARYTRFIKVADLEHPQVIEDNGDNAVKTFHEEAAKTACLGLKALLLAVNRTEERIEQWLAAKRREDFFADEASGSDVDARGASVDSEVDDEVSLPATSPPAKLAMGLGGLGLGLSPYVEDDDGDIDMEYLPE